MNYLITGFLNFTTCSSPQDGAVMCRNFITELNTQHNCTIFNSVSYIKNNNVKITVNTQYDKYDIK